MKEIKVEFSNDQSEVLDYISKMCKKDTSDFIKEALICLLPVNEYIAYKQNLIVMKNDTGPENKQHDLNEMNNQMQQINESTNSRLKRIGII